MLYTIFNHRIENHILYIFDSAHCKGSARCLPPTRPCLCDKTSLCWPCSSHSSAKFAKPRPWSSLPEMSAPKSRTRCAKEAVATATGGHFTLPRCGLLPIRKASSLSSCGTHLKTHGLTLAQPVFNPRLGDCAGPFNALPGQKLDETGKVIAKTATKAVCRVKLAQLAFFPFVFAKAAAVAAALPAES